MKVVRPFLILLCLLLGAGEAFAQELKAKVTINTERLGSVNASQFAEMERQLTDMLNNTRWTSLQYSPAERIECAFAINLTAVEEERKYFTSQHNALFSTAPTNLLFSFGATVNLTSITNLSTS